MNKGSRILALLAVLGTFQTGLEARAKNRQAVEKVRAIEIVEKVNDYYQANNEAETSAFWDYAAYHTGNMEAYRLTGKAKYLEYSDKWARHNKWMGATEPDRGKWLYKKYGEGEQYVLFGDWQICFQTYLDLYETNPNGYKMSRAKEVADWMVASGSEDYWWWADALYMAMPYMAKMYKATGDERYLDTMTECLHYADSIMWDDESHLYYRDAKYVYPSHKTESGSKDFWARGDGWVLAGLAKTLEIVPKDYKGRAFMEERFKALSEACSKLQHEEGYWTRSMGDEDQAEGPETSGTALMAYGLMWGVDNGLLERSDYQVVCDRAWDYLIGTALQEDGSVGYVQPIGEKAIKGQVLTAQNTANFGYGVFLLAACERARFESGMSEGEEVKIRISNKGTDQRNEVVETDAKEVLGKLGLDGGRLFVVKNAIGQEIPSQLTYDGKLLFEVSVRPGSTAEYTISKGTPKQYVNTCYGRMYPERVDDVAWENDRGAYRCYGPALERSGEDAYGNDVWVKNTPDLVVEQRYWMEDVSKPIIAKLKERDEEGAKALEMRTSYHYDQGYGLDCYKVGPSLGCGTPAIIEGDSIIFPYCYREYELLDNGPLRFTVRLVYNPKKIGSGEVTETRILSLDKGSNYNKMVVSYEGIEEPIDVGSGVVIHTEDTESIVVGDGYIVYADPTDNPKGQNFQIFVGAIFPDGADEIRNIMYKNPTRGNAGHSLGIRKGMKSGDSFTYYFGSAWSKYDCRTLGEWKVRTEGKKYALENPLEIEF